MTFPILAGTLISTSAEARIARFHAKPPVLMLPKQFQPHPGGR
ncbi:hypothetical protein [Haloferula sp.]